MASAHLDSLKVDKRLFIGDKFEIEILEEMARGYERF